MANEKRLIDANAVVAELKENVCKNCNSHNGIRCDYCWADDVIDFLQETPTVDAVEVVHGRWVKHKPKPEAMRAWHRQGIGKAMSENSIFWTCSCCEEWGTPRYNYCPNCGAKMVGGNEDG